MILAKKKWSIDNVEDKVSSVFAIDDNKFTNWKTTKEILSNYKINLGKEETILGFTYTPDQENKVEGVITHFSFYGSLNGIDWKLLSKGEFSNIMANPIQQKILFQKKVTVKYIKLVADKIMDNSQTVMIAEIGLLTK